jgi:hypothetical protein
MEIAIGITCGNLPLLRSIFRRFFESTDGTSRDPQYPMAGGTSSTGRGRSEVSHTSAKGLYSGDWFERMDDRSFGGDNDIELHDRKFRGGGTVTIADVHIHEGKGELRTAA